MSGRSMRRRICAGYFTGVWTRFLQMIRAWPCKCVTSQNEANSFSYEVESIKKQEWAKRGKQLRRFLTLLTAISILSSMAAMTAEERVGQLFLVTFQGTDTHDQTQIYDLIVNHHVGGVVLLAGNDNFLPQPDTIAGAHQLIGALQTIEADAVAASKSDGQSNDLTYVPLFVEISQE